MTSYNEVMEGLGAGVNPFELLMKGLNTEPEPKPETKGAGKILDFDDDMMARLRGMLDPEDALDDVLDEMGEPREWKPLVAADFRRLRLPEEGEVDRYLVRKEVQKALDKFSRKHDRREWVRMNPEVKLKMLLDAGIIKSMDEPLYPPAFQHRGWKFTTPEGLEQVKGGDDVPPMEFVIFDRGRGKYRYDVSYVYRNEPQQQGAESSIKRARAFAVKIFRYIGTNGLLGYNPNRLR